LLGDPEYKTEVATGGEKRTSQSKNSTLQNANKAILMKLVTVIPPSKAREKAFKGGTSGLTKKGGGLPHSAIEERAETINERHGEKKKKKKVKRSKGELSHSERSNAQEQRNGGMCSGATKEASRSKTKKEVIAKNQRERP